jgi:MFS family permease
VTDALAPPVPEELPVAEAPIDDVPGSILRTNSAFRNFWLANLISLLGSQISLVALPLVAVLVLHAGAAQMGYLTAAITAPTLFFGLHFGAWVDRRGRRRQTMMAADIGRAALLASIPIAYAFDALTIAQLYVAGFLAGTLSVLFTVAYSPLLAAIVPRHRVVEGNQIVHGTIAFSYMGGSSLGGALVQALSAPVAVVFDALSFLGSAFFLRKVNVAEPATEQAEKGHLAEGIRFIRRTPIMLASLASMATINLFTFAFFALFILYMTRSLGISPSTIGLIIAVGAIGGVIGAVGSGPLSKRIGIGRTVLLGSFMFPAPLLLVPAASGPRALVLGMLFLAQFLSGFGLMMQDISGNSITQTLIPDRLRSRVQGAYMVVNYGVRPVGAILGGLLGSAIGLQETLYIVTACAIAGSVVLLPSPIPRLRELPDQLE